MLFALVFAQSTPGRLTERGRRGIARNAFRETEIVQIVATAPAYGKNCRKRLASSSGSPDTLLIVETLGRHICLKDGPKAPDVDTHLHGCSNGQHVNCFGRFLQNPRHLNILPLRKDVIVVPD